VDVYQTLNSNIAAQIGADALGDVYVIDTTGAGDCEETDPGTLPMSAPHEPANRSFIGVQR
jgi:hypothetical protein